ncbi:MAG: glycosyltransferase family 9 protein [Magnetococcales bacterium]|nr:glycosyltransferase family 9 protein [Magnetococcales bacterium]
MHPDYMRLIDRWLGSPLCCIASCMARIRRPAPPREPRRILLICIAETGALVLAHPALQWIRRRYPDAELYFLSFKSGQGILNLMGLASDHQIILRSAPLSLFVLDTWRAILKLRRLRLDATINLEVYTRFSTLLAFLSGAGRRIGFHRFFEEGHYMGRLLTHGLIYNPHQHITRSYLSLAMALQESPSGEPMLKARLDHEPLQRLKIDRPVAAREAMWARIQRLHPPLTPQFLRVILNANASDLIPARRWQAERFVALAQRFLAAHEAMVILLTGSPAERPALERLCEQIGDPRVINMAGETTLETLIDLYSLCHLMVTNDSGPVHFSSVTDIPLVALFGPETPRLFGPVSPHARVIHHPLACSPCVSVYNQKRSPCTDNRCMQAITVEEVYGVARELLVEDDMIEKKKGAIP